jgi:hypothetical protein
VTSNPHRDHVHWVLDSSGQYQGSFLEYQPDVVTYLHITDVTGGKRTVAKYSDGTIGLIRGHKEPVDSEANKIEKAIPGQVWNHDYYRPLIPEDIIRSYHQAMEEGLRNMRQRDYDLLMNGIWHTQEEPTSVLVKPGPAPSVLRAHETIEKILTKTAPDLPPKLPDTITDALWLIGFDMKTALRDSEHNETIKLKEVVWASGTALDRKNASRRMRRYQPDRKGEPRER